jgi:beta-lactamase class A
MSRRNTLLQILLGISTAFIFVNVIFDLTIVSSTSNDLLVPVSKTSVKPQTSKEPIIVSSRRDDFNNLIAAIENNRGTYGIYIKNLATGETYEYNSGEQFYAASLHKLPIAQAVINNVEAGNMAFKQNITYTEDDYFTGTGSIIKTDFDTDYTVEDLLFRLLNHSDNIAQVMLTKNMSARSVNEAFITLSPLQTTDFLVENITTPFEIAGIFENIYNNKVNTQLIASISEDTGNVTSNVILKMLLNTPFNDRLISGFEKNYLFAHKIGNWPEDSLWHDCGILFADDPIVVCFMSKGAVYEEVTSAAKRIAEFL